MRNTLLLVLALALAACGGSNEPRQVKVELDTPEGAIAAYRYAVTYYDEKVAEQVFAAEDRETLMANFRSNVRKFESNKTRFEVEVGQAMQIRDDVVVAQVKWIQLDSDGKRIPNPETNWVAWLKESDGLWRVSQKESRAYRAWLAEQARNQPVPDTPAPSNEPAPSNAPAPGNG